MSESPVHVVLWDHQNHRLIVGTQEQADNAGMAAFLENQPGMATVRRNLTGEQADQLVRSYRQLIEARIRGNGVIAA
ncbi:hypothetical protein [Caldimonas sp. KR1-144]|uniref:hypothetical protein n=1 Tax=Caldimonas sp. KR1-144 TaxID=3400911 RepID=UPI003C05F458